MVKTNYKKVILIKLAYLMHHYSKFSYSDIFKGGSSNKLGLFHRSVSCICWILHNFSMWMKKHNFYEKIYLSKEQFTH